MRPALFALDAERAHRLTIRSLAVWGRLGAPGGRSVSDNRLATRVAGLDFANPLGLAAGVDKDGEAVTGLHALGFGAVEVGTLTPLPQPGNPKPRLFRLVEDEAVINRMFFNNGGLDAALKRLPAQRAGVLGLNVGANKESADRAADYVRGMGQVWRHAAYVTANISSPNTPGLRGLQERGALEDLLGRMNEARALLAAAHGVRPLFLKIAPDLDETAVRDIAELALAAKLDALIVSNTTLQRPPQLTSDHREEAGGLSGQPLFHISTHVLRLFAQALQGRLPLIGVGGVESGVTALAKIKAGASAVQLYSALVFQGPGLAARIADELDGLLAAEGFDSVADAVGKGA